MQTKTDQTKTYRIDMLTKDSVSVETRTVISVEVDGATKEFESSNNRKAYVNSAEGRKEITAEMPEDIINAVGAMWGKRPTVFPDNES